MITPQSLKAAREKLAKEKGLTPDELDQQLFQSIEDSQFTEDCLTFFEWEQVFEGTINSKRAIHLLTCPACRTSLVGELPD